MGAMLRAEAERRAAVRRARCEAFAMGHQERLGAGSRVLCQTAQRGGVGLCEDRTQDGPASGEKGSNVGPLARLYSG